MTNLNTKFYYVSRSRHGGATHVSFDTLPALAVGRRGDPLNPISRYTIADLGDCFGDDRAEWPEEAVELVEAGATEVAHIGGDNRHGEWMNAADLTDEREAAAYIEAIDNIDDGTIRAVLTEKEALDAIRTNRHDEGYGSYMATGAALAKYIGIVDTDGRAISVGDEVEEADCDDDGNRIVVRRGRVAAIERLEEYVTVEWQANSLLEASTNAIRACNISLVSTEA